MTIDKKSTIVWAFICLVSIVLLSTQNKPDIKNPSTDFLGVGSNVVVNLSHKPQTIDYGNKTMENENHLFGAFNPGLPSSLFKTQRRDPELLRIEQKLHQINAWENRDVQRLYRLAKFGTDTGRKMAIASLTKLINDYQELEIHLEDPFLPYATVEQISNNGTGVHILNQAYNNIPMYAPLETFPLCWLILGSQGGGKSSALFNMLNQLSTPMLQLDPKGIWRFRANQLMAEYIDDPYVCFDLAPPPNIDLSDWLFSYMEGVALVTGLQYGLSYLYEACDIAVEQQKRYLQETGQNTALSLKDIYAALQLCHSSNPKQTQYLESAKTALMLLLGKSQLFANRGGLPMDRLLIGRYILGCRYPTAVQSRMIGWHILHYEYYRSFKLPETTQLRGVIVFDDSSKFISRPDNVFGSGSRTSSYLHLLSTLRSTGRSVIFIDQLVEPICDDVKQLCNNWLVVGGMRGTHSQNEIASAMALTFEQAQMLGKLQTREAVCFCPKLYPHPIHGFIPVVPEPEENRNG